MGALLGDYSELENTDTDFNKNIYEIFFKLLYLDIPFDIILKLLKIKQISGSEIINLIFKLPDIFAPVLHRILEKILYPPILNIILDNYSNLELSGFFAKIPKNLLAEIFINLLNKSKIKYNLIQKLFPFVDQNYLEINLINIKLSNNNKIDKSKIGIKLLALYENNLDKLKLLVPEINNLYLNPKLFDIFEPNTNTLFELLIKLILLDIPIPGNLKIYLNTRNLKHNILASDRDKIFIKLLNSNIYLEQGDLLDKSKDLWIDLNKLDLNQLDFPKINSSIIAKLFKKIIFSDLNYSEIFNSANFSQVDINHIQGLLSEKDINIIFEKILPIENIPDNLFVLIKNRLKIKWDILNLNYKSMEYQIAFERILLYFFDMVPTKIIKKIIPNLPDINFGKSYESPNINPLLWACHNNKKKLVKLLTLNGANLNIISDKGATPLEFCFQNNNFKLAYFLVKKGARMVNNNRGALIFINSDTLLSKFIEDIILGKYE